MTVVYREVGKKRLRLYRVKQRHGGVLRVGHILPRMGHWPTIARHNVARVGKRLSPPVIYWRHRNAMQRIRLALRQEFAAARIG